MNLDYWAELWTWGENLDCVLFAADSVIGVFLSVNAWVVRHVMECTVQPAILCLWLAAGRVRVRAHYPRWWKHRTQNEYNALCYFVKKMFTQCELCQYHSCGHCPIYRLVCKSLLDSQISTIFEPLISTRPKTFSNNETARKLKFVTFFQSWKNTRLPWKTGAINLWEIIVFLRWLIIGLKKMRARIIERV